MSLISFNINLAYKSGINVKTITNFVESKKTSSLPIKPIIGSFHVVLNKQNKERKKQITRKMSELTPDEASIMSYNVLVFGF